MQRITGIHWIIAGFILNSVLVAFIVAWNMPRQSVVTFDKGIVLKQFITQVTYKKLTSEKTQQLTTLFAKALKESIDEYAKEHDSVVIKKEMVLASHADVTELLALRIADKMRGAS
jgi:type-F conjugative transfer system protein TrbI